MVPLSDCSASLSYLRRSRKPPCIVVPECCRAKEHFPCVCVPCCAGENIPGKYVSQVGAVHYPAVHNSTHTAEAAGGRRAFNAEGGGVLGLAWAWAWQQSVWDDELPASTRSPADGTESTLVAAHTPLALPLHLMYPAYGILSLMSLLSMTRRQIRAAAASRLRLPLLRHTDKVPTTVALPLACCAVHLGD